MSNKLVLITGANGHIGFRVVVSALQAGYKVKAVVRSQEKADRVLAAKSIKELDAKENLTFAFVSDMLAAGAYDAAVQDVDYIIHIASPLPNGVAEDKYEEELIKPAVGGTLSIIKAAQTSSTVKRIVITSSVLAMLPWHDFFEAETDRVFDERSRIDSPPGPYKSDFEAYAASKAHALNATNKYLEEAKPSFDVVNVCPSFVIGKDELVTEAKNVTGGTNGTALRQVLGVKQGWPTPSTSVHLDDVVTAHIKALEPTVPANTNLVVNSEGVKGTTWGDAIEIVNRKFPRAVAAGVLPNDGFAPTKHTGIDASETGKMLGIEFKSYEEQVVSVVTHYLELSGVEAA
jgi:nucleoside-diphosphate-sugar epimerase